MRSSSIAILVFATATAGYGADPAVKEVESAIKVLNDTFKTGNATNIKALMAEDHVAFTPWGGRQTRDEQIRTLPELKLTEYEPGPMTVTMLGADGALVAYSLKLKGTFEGKALPTRCYASAVWVKRGGKWLELHYQETAASGK